MQHFVYVECTFGHIYYTIPINNISQGFLPAAFCCCSFLANSFQTAGHPHTHRQTGLAGHTDTDTARRQRFSLWYLQRHRQLVIVLPLAQPEEENSGAGKMGAEKHGRGKGGDMESILFTSISQHSHTAAQIKGSPSRGAKMVVP